jgi:hypothetical protein
MVISLDDRSSSVDLLLIAHCIYCMNVLLPLSLLLFPLVVLRTILPSVWYPYRQIAGHGAFYADEGNES